MRTIKFRAWDKIDKKMYDNVGLSLIGVQVYAHPDSQPPEEVILDRGRDCFEIMQFTGLFDKNGKEIYEKDIVMYCAEEVCVIEWDNTGCCYFVSNEKDNYASLHFKFGAGSSKDMEVIGNIYEHKHLLNN